MIPAYASFLQILRCHLTGEPLTFPEQPDWPAVAELAVRHSLQAIVWHMLRNVPGVPAEVLQRLQKGYHRTVFADAQLEHMQQQIMNALTDARIDHVFLRGICIKRDYPVPALRSMGDVDVLVHTRDYGAIRKIMESLGATAGEQDDNHRSYLFPTGALVEFHPNLLRHTSPGAAQLNPGWQFVQPQDSPCRVMNEEGYYLNVLGHLIHHLTNGGTGVRSVMDVWVCRHRRVAQPNRAAVEQVLEEAGLLQLARNIEALSEVWFGDGEATPVLDELGMYILTGATYGTPERVLLTRVSLAGGKWEALQGKVFPPRNVLEDAHPWSKGRPLLLPAAWAARLWQKATLDGGRLLKRWGKGSLSQKQEAVDAHSEMFRRFGLEQNGKDQ